MKIGWLIYSKHYNAPPGTKETVVFHEEKPKSYSGRLAQIVYTETKEIEGPEPICNHIWWSFGDSDLSTCRLCGETKLEE